MGTESEEAAFLAALEADPFDSVARLVYADWLQEQGDRGSDEAEQRALATGYTAMGQMGVKASGQFSGWIGNVSSDVLGGLKDSRGWEHYGPLVHPVWFKAIIGGLLEYGVWWNFPTIAEADRATALAFGTLSENDRADILSEVLV